MSEKPFIFTTPTALIFYFSTDIEQYIYNWCDHESLHICDNHMFQRRYGGGRQSEIRFADFFIQQYIIIPLFHLDSKRLRY
jgi:hypothetical protein